jgi:hypothetical protein
MINITLTEDRIRMLGKRGSGFNRKQIELLGLRYPPSSGWMRALKGTTITSELYQMVLQAQTGYQIEYISKETPKKVPVNNDLYISLLKRVRSEWGLASDLSPVGERIILDIHNLLTSLDK